MLEKLVNKEIGDSISNLLKGVVIGTTILYGTISGCKKNPVQNKESDNIIPIVKILEGPSGITHTDAPVFTFEGTDPDGSINFYHMTLKNSNWRDDIKFTQLAVNDNIFRFRDLVEDNYTLNITAEDNDGDLSISALRKFTVDLTNGSIDSNLEGLVYIDIGNDEISLMITDEDTGEPLENIQVSHDRYPDDNVIALLLDDPTGNHLSKMQYLLDVFTRPTKIIDISTRMTGNADYVIAETKRVLNPENSKLTYIGTAPLTVLADFYDENDNLYDPNTISFLEFISDIFDDKSLNIAAKLGEFRRTFIENLAANSELQEGFGFRYPATTAGVYDADSHYFDIYRLDKLGVLNHFVNKDVFTLKGKVYDEDTNLGIPDAKVQYNDELYYTNSDGVYIITNLTKGNHTVYVEAEGYGEGITTRLLEPLQVPPYFVSRAINFGFSRDGENPIPSSNDIIYFIQARTSNPKNITEIVAMNTITEEILMRHPNVLLLGGLSLSSDETKLLFSRFGGLPNVDTENLWILDIISGKSQIIKHIPGYDEAEGVWLNNQEVFYLSRTGFNNPGEFKSINLQNLEEQSYNNLPSDWLLDYNANPHIYYPEHVIFSFKDNSYYDVGVFQPQGSYKRITNNENKYDNKFLAMSPDVSEIIYLSNRNNVESVYKYFGSGEIIEFIHNKNVWDADYSDDGQYIILSYGGVFTIVDRYNGDIINKIEPPPFTPRYSPQW